MAVVHYIRALVKPISVVVHIFTTHVGPNCLNFLRYHFLKGVISCYGDASTPWTIGLTTVCQNWRTWWPPNNAAPNNLHVQERFPSPISVIDFIFGLLYHLVWRCNDEGMHFRISMQNLITLWSSKRKA